MKTVIRNLAAILLLMILTISCVSKEKYLVLSAKASQLRKENSEIRTQKTKLNKTRHKFKNAVAAKDKFLKSKTYEIKKYLTEMGLECNIKSEELNPLELKTAYPKRKEIYEKVEIQKNLLDVANKTKWLNKEEKEVYYYLNYARVYPVDFCNEFIIPLYKKNPEDVYLATLIMHLNEMKPLNPVTPDRQLFEESLCHAKSTGEAGITGHDRISSSCSSSFMAESISYGDTDAAGHIVNLLVDSGVESLGHRYICLGEGYTVCGIAKAPHTVYTENIVLDFR
ncbi:MAG: hypothetical protein ACK5AY_12350 [Bacteroidota bacterium]|jgi:hypothetical protein